MQTIDKGQIRRATIRENVKPRMGEKRIACLAKYLGVGLKGYLQFWIGIDSDGACRRLCQRQRAASVYADFQIDVRSQCSMQFLKPCQIILARQTQLGPAVMRVCEIFIPPQRRTKFRFRRRSVAEQAISSAACEVKACSTVAWRLDIPLSCIRQEKPWARIFRSMVARQMRHCYRCLVAMVAELAFCEI